MEKTDVTAFYVSPLGRAQDTASVTLKRLGRSAKTYHWLREFHAPIYDKKTKKLSGPWDLMPSYFTKEDDLYVVKKWADTVFLKQGRVKQEYRKVSQGLDKVLKAHGYERKDKYYKAVNANKDTIVFFCHFGVECVMLSHLLNISPVCLWQGFCAAPTSVTTLYTEEREKGIAVWRCSSFGDISHLYAGNEEPAFAARFCEIYDDMSQRH